MEDLETWHRLKGEHARAHAAFTVYRDLGPEERSLSRTAERVGKSLRLMQRWSSVWRWVERTEAWDSHLDRQRLKAQEKAREEMAERHIQEGMALQGLAVAAIKALKKFAESAGGDPKLAPVEIVRLLDLGVKIERLSRGEPTENIREELAGEIRVLRLPVKAGSIDEWKEQIKTVGDTVEK